MRSYRKLKFIHFAIFMALAFGVFSSCNSKSEDEDEIAVTVSTTAVKNFTLQPNTKILSNLDSVYFSIDLEHAVIYNADSLPKGTDVSRLIPAITFMNNMSSATLGFWKESSQVDTIVNYLTNPSDSIDFSRPVSLSVVAADGVNSYNYTIKVNVHKQNPDSLIWDKIAHATLPSLSSSPVAQKTLKISRGIVTLTEENNSSYSLAFAENLDMLPEAESMPVEFGFIPEVGTFSFAGENYFILSQEGGLYSSTDAKSWSHTGEKWLSIVGPYLGSVLGIKEENGILMHCHYPIDSRIKDSEAEISFPIYGRSDFHTFETGWSANPIGLFAGGRDMNGELSPFTWGFDGSAWVTLGELPVAVEEASMFPYKVYRDKGKIFSKREIDSWMIFGGIKADGSLNTEIYVSLDNGISWTRASEFMQMPDNVPALYGADIIIEDITLSSSLTDIWRSEESKKPGRWMKISYTIDGYDISWNCPYIYILGGYDTTGRLSDSIWRAVLARLQFTPDF